MDKMSTKESVALVKKHQDKLQLSYNQLKKWDGKRYIVLIGVKKIEEIKSFAIDKSGYGNMDDWLTAEKIETAKKQ